MTEPSVKPTRVVVIGTGAVGSTTAYTLLLHKRMSELVLIDVNKDKARGDALDMNHGLPFVGNIKVWAGDYSDCKDADIVVITAGAAQKPGETRLDLLKRNVKIFESIIENVTKYNTNGILLIATNPVDVLSYFSWKKSGFPANRVIGSGTLLDSARFRYLIAEELEIDPRSVHAHIIGEHGDSELPVWSRANVAGIQVDLPEERRNEIFANTRDAAYEIINAKGATFYAIALALDRICAAILRNESSVLTVSTLLQGAYGVDDVYLGVPCIVDNTGVRRVLDLDLNEQELELLARSAKTLREQIDNCACT
ncbi:L-lactate dehydrogenase [Gorillibacterium sp. sgz5001074]|uniref:L-lactate dehydrogenase n=1 Tax=Gorillibacterium sp. sgz5001074 TaxID=3446695 RepID=UPI003F664D48